MLCQILVTGQFNEGTTPRSGFIGSNCNFARSCLPLGFRPYFVFSASSARNTHHMPLLPPVRLPSRSFCHVLTVAFGLSSASNVAYRAYPFLQKRGPRQCRASCRFDLSVTRWPFHLLCHMLQYCSVWCRFADAFFCFDLFVSNCPPQAESKSFETESSCVLSAMFCMLHLPQFHAAV